MVTFSKALKVEQAQLGSEKKARERQTAKQNRHLQANKPVVKENKYSEGVDVDLKNQLLGVAKLI